MNKHSTSHVSDSFFENLIDALNLLAKALPDDSLVTFVSEAEVASSVEPPGLKAILDSLDNIPSFATIVAKVELSANG